MAFAVFEVPGKEIPKATQALNDDQVSRLTIIVKDGKSYGLADGSQLVFVEGDDAKVARAKELFGGFATLPKTQDQIRAKLMAEEDEAAGGVGFIFG
ncbi:MAG TPA: hypothetical protein VGR28_09595 [Candidatus Thermoplasmatota archaeon]|jgi:hypothetical protein|nr:hypothetical protein [Candidatus Thermoplasmatota archaeon]